MRFLPRLKPIIEGGTYRVWPRTQDLLLSAEKSYDPNMDPDSQSLLHYHWECESSSKVSAGMKQKLDSHVTSVPSECSKERRKKIELLLRLLK